MICFCDLSLGRVEDGLRSLHSASECDPRSSLPHLQLGRAYEQLNETNKALEHYATAHTLDLMRSEALYLMAHLYHRTGEMITYIREIAASGVSFNIAFAYLFLKVTEPKHHRLCADVWKAILQIWTVWILQVTCLQRKRHSSSLSRILLLTKLALCDI